MGIKRGAALVLSLIFIGLSLPISAKGSQRFRDVESTKWYARAVESLADQGIVNGMPDGSFLPNSKVTRAQFIKMLALLSGKPVEARQDRNTFSDVPQTAWHAPYIRWGVKEKVVTGRSGGAFDPDGPITRQEMAVILWRFNKNVMGKFFPQYQKMNFKDQNKVNSWAKVEVDAVGGAGLMKGYTDRTFRPGGYATRGETAQLLYRYQKDRDEYEDGMAIDDLRYIMHGGGKVTYVTTSNSLEALETSYAAGKRLIEMDFSWTTDGKLVCLHQWGGASPSRCTLEQFMGLKLYSWLTPMSLDTLAEWMRNHPEVKLIPDIKENNLQALQNIAQLYPDIQDRFIPYIYHTGEYEQVSALGYRRIMMALYNMKAGEKNYASLARFARQKDLVGIVVNPNTEYGIYAPAKSAGIPVLPYVVDNRELMLDLSRKGADGFFANTQTLTIEW